MTVGFAAFAPLDQAVAGFVASLASPGLVEAMRLLSTLHAARGIAVLLAGACAVLVALRDRASALWLLLTFYSGAALNHALKHTLQRPRPGQDALTLATDFAFPSGHAVQSTLLYGALLVLVFRHTRSRTVRAAAAAFAGLMVVAVCASRLVLQAHWFSDVVAGVLVGSAWLALAVAVRRAVGR